MERILSDYFRFDRIVNPDAQVPEYFATCLGQIELLPGPCMRYWWCSEYPTQSDGIAGLRVLIARLVMPLDALRLCRAYSAMWQWQHGLSVVKPDFMPAKAQLQRAPKNLLMH